MNEKVMTRLELPLLFVQMGLKTGVEIGVHKGYFSKSILEVSGIEKLHSVDIWLNTDGSFASNLYEECRDRLAIFGTRSEIVICPSPKAAERFCDGSLGFVYIDANHSFEACSADLDAWMPKVMPGGVISGHDYKNRGMAQTKDYLKEGGAAGRCRVRAAVDEFVKKHSLNLNVTEERCPSWWFVKPNFSV